MVRNFIPYGPVLDDWAAGKTVRDIRQAHCPEVRDSSVYALISRARALGDPRAVVRNENVQHAEAKSRNYELVSKLTSKRAKQEYAEARREGFDIYDALEIAQEYESLGEGNESNGGWNRAKI